MDTKTYVQNSPEYKLVAHFGSFWMLLSLGCTSLFKQFLQKRLPIVIFWNLTSETRVDAVNISNILNHKKVTSTILAYFRNQSPSIISYSYSFPIAPKIFNYKNVLQGLNTENITRNPSACSCKASEFCYNPVGHVITGDLNIVRISKLREFFPKALNIGNPGLLLGNRIPN